MARVFAYFLLGFLFVLIQTTIAPRILPGSLKPDLLLILVVYLGLHEDYVRGGVLAYALGCLNDVFAGHYLGLYGLALLATFLVVRGVAARLNIESAPLLLFLVLGGTFLETGLLFFSLGFFADTGPLLKVFLDQIFYQLALNLGSALLLLLFLPQLQKILAPRTEIPGLAHLNKRYES